MVGMEMPVVVANVTDGVQVETNDQRTMSVVAEVKRTGQLPYHVSMTKYEFEEEQNVLFNTFYDSKL